MSLQVASSININELQEESDQPTRFFMVKGFSDRKISSNSARLGVLLQHQNEMINSAN
jgi:hypothetical protein